MRPLFLAIFMAISARAFAGEWRPIAPLDFCPRFHIEYQVSGDGEYQVRIPSPSGPRPLGKLKDINDLSSLTDVLLEESAKVCNDGMYFLKADSKNITMEDRSGELGGRPCKIPYSFSPPYVDLAKQMVKVLQFNGNRCDQMMAYTGLQTKISELSGQDLIELENPGNLFHKALAIFTGDETDRMIRMYNTCGGKRFTDKFVANLILLEAKNACVMPSPPGIFSFEEAKTLAQKIGKRHDNLSLTELNGRKGEITREAVLSLAKAGMKKEIKPLLGDYVQDIDAFIENMDAVKNLKNSDFKNLDPDLVSLGFKLDATMETARKAVPLLAKSSISEMLPPEWSQKRKSDFLDKELGPSAEKAYAACMAPHRAKINSDGGFEGSLRTKKELKERYCHEHPRQCKSKGCGGQVNILSGDPAVPDSAVAQGCVMRAMLDAVKPTIKALIGAQKENVKDMFDLTPEMAERFSKKTWTSMIRCSNQLMGASADSETAAYDPANPPILNDPKFLQSVSPQEFEQTLRDCAGAAQVEVAKDFYALALSNQSAFTQAISPNPGAFDFDGDKSAEEIKLETERIVDETLAAAYDPCIEKQVRELGSYGDSADPMLCVPMVEMAAASKVIGKKIKDTFRDNGVMDKPEARLAVKEFENCAHDAGQRANDALFATDNRSVAINSPEDAQTYMSRDPHFYGCVKQAISSAVGVVGAATYDQAAEELKDQLSDPDYLQRLRPGVLELTRSCFAKKLERQSSWPEFMEFNDKGGLDRAQEECSQKAVDYVLPKVVIKESARQMGPLSDEGLLEGPTEVGDILAEAAFELRRKHALTPPPGLAGDQLIEWTFAQAHNAVIAKPGGKTDEFVEEYTEAATGRTLEKIYANIKEAVLSSPKGSRHGKLFEVASPQCLSQAYSRFSPKIEALVAKVENAPAETEKDEALINVFADALIDGLNYQRSLGRRAYRNQMAALRKACENIGEHKSLRALSATGAFDFVIKGAVQKRLVESFDQVVSDQCLQDLNEKLEGKGPANLIKNACAARSKNSIEESFSELRSAVFSSGDFDAMRAFDFIKRRHAHMSSLIQRDLRDPVFIETTIFDERPSPILENIFNKFDDIAAGDRAITGALSKDIAQKLFYNDRRKTTFADEFTRIQATNGLGISGYEKAKKAVNMDKVSEAVGWWGDIVVDKNKALKAGREALSKKWNPEGIEDLMDWRRIEPAQREKLINSIYGNAVVPAIEGRDPDQEAVAADITDHALNYEYLGSNQTFADRFADHIGSETKSGDIFGFE